MTPTQSLCEIDANELCHVLTSPSSGGLSGEIGSSTPFFPCFSYEPKIEGQMINFFTYKFLLFSIFLPRNDNSPALHLRLMINWPMEFGTAGDKSSFIPHRMSASSTETSQCGPEVVCYVPFIDFMLWLSDGCDEAFEFGVVEMVDMGELGLIMSLIGVVFPPPWPFISNLTLLLLLLLLWCSDDEFEWLDTFCWAIRSCFRNLARRFWNQTCG